MNCYVKMLLLLSAFFFIACGGGESSKKEKSSEAKEDCLPLPGKKLPPKCYQANG